MLNFTFNLPVRIHFGTNCFHDLISEIKRYGTKPLIVYGGGSIKKNGAYDAVINRLSEANICFAEMGGVEPNPRYESVCKGIKICKDEKCDLVLPIGGASSIDCAKAIAGCFFYEGEPWDIINKKTPIIKALPVLAIPTLAAAGSEMSMSAVISKMDIHVKTGILSPHLLPKVAFMNPEFTYTQPKHQTAAGIADAISHVMECYFSNNQGAYFQARFGEAILKTLFHYGVIAYNNPFNYEARSNIMWACSWAMNGTVARGNNVGWSLHGLEHELSAFYDITHGDGLAVLIPAWLTWALNKHNAYRYVDLLQNVFGIDASNVDVIEAAKLTIQKTRDYFDSLGLPRNLKDLGIDRTNFKLMANRAVSSGGQLLKQAFVPIDEKGALEIYNLAY